MWRPSPCSSRPISNRDCSWRPSRRSRAPSGWQFSQQETVELLLLRAQVLRSIGLADKAATLLQEKGQFLPEPRAQGQGGAGAGGMLDRATATSKRPARRSATRSRWSSRDRWPSRSAASWLARVCGWDRRARLSRSARSCWSMHAAAEKAADSRPAGRGLSKTGTIRSSHGRRAGPHTTARRTRTRSERCRASTPPMTAINE